MDASGRIAGHGAGATLLVVARKQPSIGVVRSLPARPRLEVPSTPGEAQLEFTIGEEGAFVLQVKVRGASGVLLGRQDGEEAAQREGSTRPVVCVPALQNAPPQPAMCLRPACPFFPAICAEPGGAHPGRPRPV